VEILFRKFPGGDVVPPEPGEMHIRPRAHEDRDRRDLARLVLQRGVDVFAGGSGPIQRVVVNADPSLDDLLAATFTIRLLAGDKLPESSKTFADYAALVREGLKPSTAPLQDSLEGLFLALRNAGGEDLTDAAVGARFAADWTRMADGILQAAVKGVDPFTTTLFGAGQEFARERAFLIKDHEVFRQDVLSGEQWFIKIPGGPPQGMALLLRRPKSLLFKYWSRRDQEAPSGQTFLLLAVSWGTGQWVFSTDPVQRLPLKALAEALQAAEMTHDSGRAGQDPWFDGKPFGHTLVAAPRGGTALADDKVLRIVKQWTGAKPFSTKKRGSMTRWAATAAALLVAAGLGSFFFAHVGTNGPSGDPNQGRGLLLDDDGNGGGLVPSVKGNLHLVAVGVSKYRIGKYNLAVADTDAKELASAFDKQSRSLFGTSLAGP